jgi:hypothetical protein
VEVKLSLLKNWLRLVSRTEQRGIFCSKVKKKVVARCVKRLRLVLSYTKIINIKDKTFKKL